MNEQDPFARYAPQTRFAPLGIAGQHKLSSSTVLVAGCGGLGTNSAGLLCRAGVGRLRIVDSDRAELTNLHRQVLLDEADAATAREKPLAAKTRLEAANSSVTVEHAVARISAGNIASLAAGCDLIVDATDNVETRLAINDFCVKSSIPWVYGGAVGSWGMALAVLPGKGACLRCVFSDLSPAAQLPNSITHGVIGPAPAAVAAIQSGQALRILCGEPFEPRLAIVDVWDLSLRTVEVKRNLDCPACSGK